MCTILKFDSSQTPAQHKKTYSRVIKNGEIILFPGVRYERHADAPANNAKQPEIERDILIL